jgi:hypothetical protein
MAMRSTSTRTQGFACGTVEVSEVVERGADGVEQDRADQAPGGFDFASARC